MKKKSIDKKEDKVSRIVTRIASMGIDEEIKFSTMARSIGLHPHTLRDKLDEWQTFMEAGKIAIIGDKQGKIKRLVRIEDKDRDLFLKKQQDWIFDKKRNLDNPRRRYGEIYGESLEQMEERLKRLIELQEVGIPPKP